jgi:hypothetical protein
MRSRTARQTAESAECMYDFLSLMKPRALDLGYHKARLSILQHSPDRDFGLCPRYAREEDLVVLLAGGSVPSILRERPWPVGMTALDRLSEVPCYEFIGERYVEVFMDGREAGKTGVADDDLDRCKYL